MRRATVLLVEDDPTVLQLLRTCFEMDDFEVLRAEDGSAGLQLALERRPDVIVSDISMPNMTGLEMMAALKRDPVAADIPIVLLASESQLAEVVDVGFAAGADRLVSKPFEPIDLIDRVNELLRASPRAGRGTLSGQ